MKVSVIIRAKNEERWITACLKAVFSQSFKNFEVILVDNHSVDKTVMKAKQFKIKILTLRDYSPGKALNLAIKEAKGEFLVSLSAHCIPRDSYWLMNLLRNFQDKSVAGVYGRQEPMHQTSDLDKRDLWIVFGLDKRVQTKDSFFHNANSMIRRSVWNELPFNERISNIEDRVWGKQVIQKNYKIIYEPEASVYHYHGIHQSADRQRCKDIIKIMESIEPLSQKEESLIDNLNIVALIAIKGKVEYLGSKPLIEYTLRRAKESRFIDRIIVLTDNQPITRIAKKLGAQVPFIRPPELSTSKTGLEQVLQYSLEEIEKDGIFPDLIVHLGAQAPFRPISLIDNLIELQFHNGFDSTFPGYPTYKSCWRQVEGDFQRLDEGFYAKKVKKPIYIGYPALGCVTYPEFIRQGRLLGDMIGIFEISDKFLTLEITDSASQEWAQKVFPEWWKKQKK